MVGENNTFIKIPDVGDPVLYNVKDIKSELFMLRASLEVIDGGVIVIEKSPDNQYYVRYVNDEFCHLFYLNKAEALKLKKNDIEKYVDTKSLACINRIFIDTSYNGARFNEKIIFTYHEKAIHFHVNGVVKQSHKSLLYCINVRPVQEPQFESEQHKSQRVQVRLNENEPISKIHVWTFDIQNKRVIITYNGKKYHIGETIENVPESIIEQGMVLPKSIQDLRNLFKKIDAGQHAAVADIWFYDVVTQTSWCEQITYMVVYDDSGKAVFANGIGRDVTELKNSQQKYEELLATKTELAKNSIGCYRLNLTKNWCYEGVGDLERAKHVLADGTVDGFFEYVYSQIVDSKMLSEFKTRFNRDALLRAYEQKVNNVKEEYLYCVPNGKIQWVETGINMARNPNTGDVEGIIYTMNIHEQHQIRVAIQTIFKNRYRCMVFLNANYGTFSVYYKGQDQKVKSHYLENYDKACDFFSRRFVKEPMIDKFIQEIQIEHILSMLDGPDAEYEKIFQSGLDETKVRMLQFRFSYTEYKQKEILLTCTDITDTIIREHERNKTLEKALEQVRQANEAKSNFLQQISHDMRTPMNGIIGLTALTLKRNDLTEEVRQNLLDINNSGEFLLNLINDTLDINKIESNKLKLHLEAVNYGEIIDNLCTCIRPLLDEKHLNFQIDYINTKPCEVVMDKLRVQQIFMNLLSNAIKFSTEGGDIRCIIERLYNKRHVSYVRFVVKDNGIGMSQEFLPKIFTPFEQEDNFVTMTYTGTGLGMPIVKKLVDMMDGRIEVKSTQGEGTEVITYLSFEHKEEKNLRGKDAIDISILENKHVLLCEDHPLNAKVATCMLQDKGMIVENARNGKEAIEMVKQSENGYYDIILMDLRMPIMDGLTATKYIRNLKREDSKTIPIVAMTGNAYVEDVEACEKAGMNDHISKPIDMELLYKTIHKNIYK
jgi:signal transduction histidine kinase/ActR/RegA family two-component response regulator